MIRLFRIAPVPAAPNSAFAPKDLLGRFMFVTNEAVSGDFHLQFVFDGVGRINMTNATTVAVHPMAEGISSSDHHEPSPTALQVDCWLSTMLTEDIPDVTSTPLRTVDPGGSDGVRSVLLVGPSTFASLSARTADVVNGLVHSLGVPCTIYTPRYGILAPMALVGFDVTHETAARVGFALSFQEIRVAENVDSVLVPSIPRVVIQTPPTADWSLPGIENGVQDALTGPSIWKVQTGAEYGPSPDQPLADRQYNDLSKHDYGIGGADIGRHTGVLR